MHGWHRESTDGPKAGWSWFFFGVVAVVNSATTAECSVAWFGVMQCRILVVVVVVVVVLWL